MVKMTLPESVALCSSGRTITAPGASAHSEAEAIARKTPNGWCVIRSADWHKQYCIYWMAGGELKYREYAQEVTAK